MEFIKQHKDLYDKTNNSFKDKQKKEQLWEQLAATRNLPVKTVNKWVKIHCTRYGKLTQTKSGQAAEKSTEQQTWLKDSFSFLRGHISFEHQSQATTASSRDYHHFCRSSLRSVSADEVDDFHISGCTSGPHSKSKTVVLQLSPL